MELCTPEREPEHVDTSCAAAALDDALSAPILSAPAYAAACTVLPRASCS